MTRYIDKYRTSISRDEVSKAIHYMIGKILEIAVADPSISIRQHDISRFFLEHIKEDNQLVKHNHVFTRKGGKLLLKEAYEENINPDTYSRGNNKFLNSEEKLLTEKVFSAIERSCGYLFKTSLKSNYENFTYLSRSTYPKIFDTTQKIKANSPTEARILLSMFFATLYLRQPLYRKFITKSKPEELLGDILLENLFDVTYELYFRRWIICQVPYPVIFSSNVFTPYSSPKKEDDSFYFMPLSKNRYIFFDYDGTKLKKHNDVITNVTNNHALYESWFNWVLKVSITDSLSIPTRKGLYEISLCTTKDNSYIRQLLSYQWEDEYNEKKIDIEYWAKRFAEILDAN